MNLVWAPSTVIGQFIDNPNGSGLDFHFFPPTHLRLEGRDTTLSLETRVGLAIDTAKLVGADKIIFPFNDATEIKHAKIVLKSYRDRGFFMDYYFPRG